MSILFNGVFPLLAVFSLAPGASKGSHASQASEIPDQRAPQFITLSHQHAGMEPASPEGSAQIYFGFNVHNDLPVAISSVQVGLLFADAPGIESFAGLDAGRLYAQTTHARAVKNVVVVRQRLPVLISPGQVESVRFVIPMHLGWPEPQSFQTHVLGYTLEHVDGPVLIRLLQTDRAADEVAATNALSLPNAHWKAEGLAESLRAVVTIPLSKEPPQAEVLQRLFGFLALGRTGHGESCEILGRYANRPGLAAYDENLQVIRSARFVSSPIETPLAFLLPDELRTMADVVNFSADLCRNPKPLRLSASVPAPSNPAPQQDPPQQSGDSNIPDTAELVELDSTQPESESEGIGSWHYIGLSGVLVFISLLMVFRWYTGRAIGRKSK